VAWRRFWQQERLLHLLRLCGLRRKRHRTPEDRVRQVLETARLAEFEGDADTMHNCSYKLIRFELYEQAWGLRIRAARLKEPSAIAEWEGEDLSGRTILIRGYMPKNRIGEELRLARFIAPVSKRARRCIVLTEARLVPLLGRSFPGIDVRPRGVDDAAAIAEADVAAYFETVALRYAKNAEEMRRSFAPLTPDPVRANSIRQRYKLESKGPLIGISWASSNRGKVLPDLKSWAPLLAWPSATFVSLQYGDIRQDLSLLENLAGKKVIHDADINQLVDLDGFAAQIAALDAVVSISNTTIDMAGMLGRPTLHIRDDKASAIWPRGGSSPWYPEMVFVYKQGRPWSELFVEVRRRLEDMLSARHDSARPQADIGL
jgi:hypothetical protein